MKIYFAGPLFTPYVRAFISQHATILRQNGIDPFVPHESFLPTVTPPLVQALSAKCLWPADAGRDQPEASWVADLLRKGIVNRKELGFARDMEGVRGANAVLALLDGTQVDDGTACEIGIFYGLMRSDPSKKGIVGWMTDSRGIRRAEKGHGINLFVLGVIEECGAIYHDFEDVLRQLKTWQAELPSTGHG
jgi:nucleoside 2-deoxyribosyltransferase